MSHSIMVCQPQVAASSQLSWHLGPVAGQRLHGAGEVGPEVGVGALGAGDPVLECLVGVRPVLVETVVLRVQEIIHCGSQSLRPRSGSCNTTQW